MKVHVLYFAAVRDAVGSASEELEVEVTTIAALLDLLRARHPALAPHLAHSRVAQNESFAPLAAALSDGDTIALIPPVSGG